MRCVFFLVFAALIAFPAHATHLVTGNGYGLAVVSPESAAITRFYAHPYSYTAPDPKNLYAEGIETTNFLNSIGLANAQNPSADYDSDSHLIRIHSSLGPGFAFMPYGLNQNALILSFKPTSPSATISVQWAHPIASIESIHIGTNPPLPGELESLLLRDTIQVIHFIDIPESLLLIPLEVDSPQSPASPNQLFSASNSWALISLDSGTDPAAAIRDFIAWRANLTPDQLAQRELSQFEAWRVKPTVKFRNEAERHLYRQSETMLRIAQSREPNTPTRHNNGMILAALPDGVYFVHWVRDMAYATLAFIRMGHQAEARAAILAYFNAQPTGKMRSMTNNADYQISVVRYFGDGSEEPFFTMEGAPNIEFDNWGEVLWVLGEYQLKFNDPTLLTTQTYRGTVYDSARDFIVKPLIANLEPYKTGLIVAADTSIWEEHQPDKKHFAFSSAMANIGLAYFATVAERNKDQKTADEIFGKLPALNRGFNAAFIRNNLLHGTLEENPKNDIDGALLPILNMRDLLFSKDVEMLSFLNRNSPDLAISTASRMEQLKVASGGYRRVTSNYTDPAIFEYWYERQEFVFTDLSLAELYRHIHRDKEADALLSRITAKAAADHNIIPEMYVALPCKLFPGKIGDPTGALPMVGYGAGAYILHLIARDETQN